MSNTLDPLSTLRAANNVGHAARVDPKTIVGTAQASSSPDEAIANIQAIAHTGNMVQMYDTLHGMDISHQAQAWGELKPGEQNTLRSLGYTPPNPEHLSHVGAGGGGGGFWGDVVSGFDSARHLAAHAASDTVSGLHRATNDTLNGLGAGLRAVQHLERASHVISEYGIAQAEGWNKAYQATSGSGFDLFDWNQYKDIFSPHDWARAWDATTNGNTQIDPAMYRHLVSQEGYNKVNAAINVVAAGGPQQYLATVPGNQQKQAWNMVQDPKFQSLVSQVSNSRMSVGRLLVGEKFLTAHHAAGSALSGTIDGALDILQDPTMMRATKVGDALTLGKSLGVRSGTGVIPATRLALYGVKTSDDAAAIVKSKPFQNYLDRVAPYVTSGNWGGLVAHDARFGSMVESLQQGGIDSKAKLEDWFINMGGLRAMMEGKAAKQSSEQLIMPHVSWLGWQKGPIKELFSNSIDKLNDARFPNAVKLAAGDVFGAGDHAALGSLDNRVASATALLEKAKLAGGFGNLPGVKNIARLGKALTTYVPSTAALSYGSGEADVVNFRRYIQGFLPSNFVDHLTSLYTEADEAQRRTLIEGAMEQQAHAMGLYNHARSALAVDNLFDAIRNENRAQSYGVKGLDRTPDGFGVDQPHAIYSTQTSKVMRIPLPAEMRKIARMNSVLTVAGVHPMNVIDDVMMYWRSLILSRPGFAVRTSTDENLLRLLRLGSKGFAGSFLATGAARTATDKDIAKQVEDEIAKGVTQESQRGIRTASLTAQSYKPIVPWHPVDRALQIIGSRMPAGLQDKWKTLEEFWGGVIGGNTRKWAREAEGKALKALSLDKYVNSATHFAKYQPDQADESIQDILAHTTGSPGFTATPSSMVEYLRKGDTGKMAYFRKAGPYSQAATGDPLYKYKWQTSLDQIARAKEGQAVLHTIDQDRETQIAAVMDVLKSEGFAEAKKSMDRSVRGRVGLLGRDATQEELDRDWAESIVDNTNAHLRAGAFSEFHTGALHRDLVDHMKETGAGPTDEQITDALKKHAAPELVSGPDMLPEAKLDGLLSKSWEHLVGKPMNWLARQPHLQHQYAIALEPAQGFVRKNFPDLIKKNGELNYEGEKMASDIALHRAHDAIIPYIHNPDLRTQFEELHRNIAPFLFAQRQFLMRWGKTFADSPEAIRKLQLTMNGLRSMGVVRTDPNGNAFFYYPGSQYVSEMIAGALNMVGVHASIPFAAPFTGEVKYMMPGLSNPVTPSVGPFVAVSMKQLEKIFPEMTSFNSAILQQGEGDTAWQQFSPSILNRLYEAIGPQQSRTQLSSAMAMQLKFMAAHNQIPGQDAGPGEIETFLSRLGGGARSIMLTRAALGFIMPATPTAQLDPAGLDARYKLLVNKMGYEQGYSEFVREYPNAIAYTAATTQGATGGSIPSTAKDLAFTNEHVGFAKTYPAAFPWLAPRSPGTFSLAEYQEQEATGQRVPLPMWGGATNPGQKSVLTDIMNAQASADYYKSVDAYDQAYTSAGSNADRKAFTSSYDDWKNNFFKAHPTFKAYIDTQQGMRDRIATIQQVKQALADPNVPKDSPAVAGLRDLMGSWDSFNQAMSPYLGKTDSQSYTAKQNYKTSIVAWGTDYIKTHPAVADFWNTILRPQIDETK